MSERDFDEVEADILKDWRVRIWFWLLWPEFAITRWRIRRRLARQARDLAAR